jgi:hypothetical protein
VVVVLVVIVDDCRFTWLLYLMFYTRFVAKDVIVTVAVAKARLSQRMVRKTAQRLG